MGGVVLIDGYSVEVMKDTAEDKEVNAEAQKDTAEKDTIKKDTVKECDYCEEDDYNGIRFC